MLLLTDDALWVKALERAHQRRTLLDQRHGTEDSEVQTWHATSFSQPNRFHVVTVLIDGRGVLVTCTCRGHEDGHPCTHAAKVLERIEMIPRYEPPKLTSQERQLILSRLNGDDVDSLTV
jgi:hypothetical protein